jgi:hypothetical protein
MRLYRFASHSIGTGMCGIFAIHDNEEVLGSGVVEPLDFFRVGMKLRKKSCDDGIL